MNDVVTIVQEQKPQFLRVLTDSTINFDREASFAVQLLQANDYLRGIALQNPESLRNAVTNVGAIGISLNPASKLAYLVPRKNAVCLDISYMGLMHIAQQCGAIEWGQAQIVRKADEFALGEIGSRPTHKFNPFDEERGDIVGVYVVVKTDGGDYLTHAMSIKDVHAIRDRSEAWKAYKRDNKKTCPWVTDEAEMVKKTCVKQAAKYWPRRERLDTAVHHVNTEGDEGITITPETMSDDEYQGFVERIQESTTKEAAKSVWLAALEICKGLGDVDSANRLKAELIKQGEFIDNAAKEAA